MENTFKVKVISADISIRAEIQYRTTKGGKKVIIGEIGYLLGATIITEPVKELCSGDFVTVDRGTLFRYNNIGDQGMFINVNHFVTEPFRIDTSRNITCCFAGRRFASEQSTRFEGIFDKGVQIPIVPCFIRKGDDE